MDKNTNTSNRNGDLTVGPIAKTLSWFTLPFLLANLLQSLYGTIDTMVIGNFGSTSGVSAVACGAQILSIATFFAIGLSSGGTVLVGQCIGAKDDKKAAQVVGNLIISFAVLSIVLMLVALFIYPYAFEILNVPEKAIPEATNYMKIGCIGIPLIIGYNIVCALLRAMGDSKSPLIFVFVASVINIIGDLLLTGWLHMGALGVAIATVVAQGFSFLFALVFIMKRGMSFPFSLKNIIFHGKTVGEIFKIGGPMGIQSILINVSFMFITAIINSMGLEASAAMGIGDKIINFAFLPQTAFSASVAVMVAQNYGAKKYDRVLQCTRFAVAVCLAFGIIVCAICQIWPELIPSVFTKDPVVRTLAGQYMRAYSIDAVIVSITFCLAGLLNGCGKTGFNLAQNMISTFLGRVPATYIFSKLAFSSLFVIGLAAPASSLMSLIMMAIYIKSGRWKK